MTKTPTFSKGLTSRQRKFADAYAVSMRGPDAAIAAGYAPKWAASCASRLLKSPEIQAAVARRQSSPEIGVCAPGGGQPKSGRTAQANDTALDFLLAVMRDPEIRLAIRLKAATALLPFMHARMAPGGKKETAAAVARELARSSSKFAPTAAPKGVYPFAPRKD